jgi:hypothetical protein
VDFELRFRLAENAATGGKSATMHALVMSDIFGIGEPSATSWALRAYVP